jgi:hypothetical protein
VIELIVCSVCLRVRDGSEWLEAERVIGKFSTYEGDLPRLHGAVCDACAEGARWKSRPHALTLGSFASLNAAHVGQLPLACDDQ